MLIIIYFLLMFSPIFSKIFFRTWDEARSLANHYVSKLTLDEKLKVIQGQGIFSGRCVGTTSEVNGSVFVPEICLQDGPAGLRSVGNVTAFPAGISAAATWNRDLMRARGVAMGREWRAKGAHVLLGPAMDVTRAPQGGRSWESFGSDPYLNGEAAYETIVGVQSQGVQACAKHLIGYQQEHFRFDMSVEIDERTLREVYFRPFKRAIDAGVTCVMCSYNKLDGLWACKNPSLTGSNGILKSEYDFKGYVVSDWGATHEGYIQTSKVNETVEAGIDLEMPGGFIVIGGGVYRNLKSSIEKNLTSIESLDGMVRRVLSGWLKLGQDQDFPKISFNVNDRNSQKDDKTNARTQDHVDLTRKIGSKSIVLLKNLKNSLPLSTSRSHSNSKKLKSLAIVGIDADQIKNKNCDMNACDLEGTIPVGWGSGTNSLENVVSPFEAIKEFIKAESQETEIYSSLSQDLEKAVEVSSKAEVAIVFAYTFSGEISTGLTNVNGNYGDRKDLKLFKGSDELIARVASSNSKTIVIINSVGSFLVEAWADHTNITSILMAGLLGEQTGPAITDVLFGKVNPSGRLPYTIGKSEDDFGVRVTPYNPFKSGLTPTVKYTEGLFTDYKRFDQLNIKPRYPFGHGLSYTTFTYSDLKLNSSSNETEIHEFSLKVKNSGDSEGTEIVQIYLGFPNPLTNQSNNNRNNNESLTNSINDQVEPKKLLRGFESIDLLAGEQKTVKFNLTQDDLKIYDLNKKSWIQPSHTIGKFKVFVGSSSLDIRLEMSF